MKIVVLREAFASFVHANALISVNSILATISKNGIESYEVDPAHVCAILANLDRSAFENPERDLPSGKATRRIDFDVDAMDRALARAKNYPYVELRIDESDDRDEKRISTTPIALRFGSIVRQIRSYEIDPTNVANSETYHSKQKPQLEPEKMPVHASVSYRDLRIAVESVKDVSDHVVFFANENGLEVSDCDTNGKDTISTSFESRAWIPKNEFDDYTRKTNARSSFPADFVSLVLKSFASSDPIVTRLRRVRLALGSDYPIEIVSEIQRRTPKSALVERLGSILFWVAPRIMNS